MRTDNRDAFFESIGKATKVSMDLSIYDERYEKFDCACGKQHIYGSHIILLCQGLWKVVMVCPEDPDYLTCVKVKMFMWVKFKGFESISGYHIQNGAERRTIFSAFNDLR